MINSTDLIYAQRLKSLRLSKKVKQFAVYEKLGFNNQQEYSKLENGKIEFTDDVIEKISNYFKITPHDFINPNSHIEINNSPHANNNSPQGVVNDIALVNSTLQAKEETIFALKHCIKLMETQLMAYEKQGKS